MVESPRLPWRTIAASTALALLAAAATVVLLSDDADEPADEDGSSVVTLTTIDDVPTFDEATFTTFAGDTVALSTVRGTPTVVNFFSSTCAPCITEMPAFEEVYQQLRGSGQIDFLGLAVADRTDDAIALVEETGVTYPTGEDKDGSVITALGGTLLPTTVILNAAGGVMSTHAGELTANELRALLVDELNVQL